MKRECLLLALLPLFSYAHADLHRDEARSDQSRSGYTLVADNGNSSMQMQNSNGQMQNSNGQTQYCDNFQMYVQDTGFFFGGEYLYWNVKEGATLEYAFLKEFPSFQPTPTSTAGNGVIGNGRMAKFNWNSGFRLNGGYQIGHDNWALEAVYTYYHTTGSNSVKRPNNFTLQPGTTQFIVQLLPTFPTQLTTFQSIQRIKSRISFTENVLDLKMEKYFAPSRFVTLGLAVGYEGAWLSQHWKTKAIAYPSSDYVVNNINNWNFKGAGPLIRLDSTWYFTRNFTFFLDAMAAAIYGLHKDHLATISSAGRVFETFQNAHANDHRFVGHTMLELGFGFDICFATSWMFNIYAAYEVNSWFNANEVYHYFNNGNINPGSDLVYSVERSPVTTHGLSLGIEFHF